MCISVCVCVCVCVCGYECVSLYTDAHISIHESTREYLLQLAPQSTAAVLPPPLTHLRYTGTVVIRLLYLRKRRLTRITSHELWFGGHIESSLVPEGESRSERKEVLRSGRLAANHPSSCGICHY